MLLRQVVEHTYLLDTACGMSEGNVCVFEGCNKKQTKTGGDKELENVGPMHGFS